MWDRDPICVIICVYVWMCGSEVCNETGLIVLKWGASPQLVGPVNKHLILLERKKNVSWAKSQVAPGWHEAQTDDIGDLSYLIFYVQALVIKKFW